MLKKPASVAVIIPCYNELPRLHDTVARLMAQSHPPAEIIIVDDGSDGAEHFRFPDAPPVRVVRQSNAGAAAARFRGVTVSTTDIVMFNDTGDVPEPDRIALHVEALERFPDCGVSFAETHSPHRALGSFARLRNIPLDGRMTRLADPLAQMLRQSWPLAMAMNIALRREVALQAANVAPEYRAANDYVLQLQAAALAPFVHVSRVTLHYAESEGGLSRLHGPVRQRAFALRAAARHVAQHVTTPAQRDAFLARINEESVELAFNLLKGQHFRLAAETARTGLRHLRPMMLARSAWWRLRQG